MNKKSIILIIIFIALLVLIGFAFSSKDLDRIQNYVITAIPQNDGTVNLIYELTWEVLDSESEGPLTNVLIGVPNSKIYDSTPLTSNIDNIETYNSNYVKINFKQHYYKGDVITFKFKINQGDMYISNSTQYTYNFTPGWFEDIEVENISIKWKSTKAISANTDVKENGYYVWTDSLNKNEKINIEVSYPSDAFNWDLESKKNTSTSNDFTKTEKFDGFAYLKTTQGNTSSTESFSIRNLFIILVVVVVLSVVVSFATPDSYYRHRGYGGYSSYRYHDYDCHHHHSHRSRSSGGVCACVKSCACACACAGGGRAGCSKKDFYGTKLKSKDILKKL